MVDLPIDEPSNGVHAGVVTVPVVAVALGDSLVAPDAADGVLDHNAANSPGVSPVMALKAAGWRRKRSAHRSIDASSVSYGRGAGPVRQPLWP